LCVVTVRINRTNVTPPGTTVATGVSSMGCVIFV
jgi:hypothetical protein